MVVDLLGGQGLHQRAFPLAPKCNRQDTSQFAIVFAERTCPKALIFPRNSDLRNGTGNRLGRAANP